MKREVATEWTDRPHEAHLVNKDSAVCECGRIVTDELHSQAARELASAQSADGIVTEKGT